MEFLDPNVIIRYLTQDHPAHAQRAYQYLPQVAAGAVTVTTSEGVLVEVVQVLSSKVLYHLPRSEIRVCLAPILRLRGRKLPWRRRYLRALDLYASYPFLDFVDALNVAQMEQAVHSKLKGQDRLRAERAVGQAVKEVAFLFFVQRGVQFRVMAERRALWRRLALVAQGLHQALRYEETGAPLRQWAEQLSLNLGEAYLWQGTVQTLAHRYFQGASPLFPDLANTLTDLVDSEERTVELYHDHLECLRPPGQRKRAEGGGAD